MLSTTFNIQQSLNGSSNHGTKTHSCGYGSHFHGKNNFLICHHCVIHTGSLWAHHTSLHFIYLCRLLDRVLLQSKGCAIKFSLHSHHLSGPLEHNICWIHEFFLWASCSNPPSRVIQIQHYGHISLFNFTMLRKKKTENTTNPVMKINSEIFVLAKDQIGARCWAAIFSIGQLNQPRLKINSKTELKY